MSLHERRDGRRSGREVLEALLDSPCPRHGCEGVLDRREYSETPAVVCRSCGTPTVRFYGAGP